jgi:hypothetical protein
MFKALHAPSPLHAAAHAAALAGALASSLCGCSFVEFEPSPYTPRRLEVVYSTQEDVTFLSWRLRDSADLSLVRFEYWDLDAEEWAPLVPSRALFPASPYPCGDGDICLQYQLKGRVLWPESADPNTPSPLRALHEDGGVFGPLDLRQRAVDVTFDVDPIAIDLNVRFDPRRYDWFAENGVPLKRSYQWRLAESWARTLENTSSSHTDTACGAPIDTDWRPLTTPTLPEGWVEEGRCLTARPLRSDSQGAEVTAPLPPSALIAARTLNYRPARLTPRAFLITLTDLNVRSASRCATLTSEIIGAVRESFNRRFPAAVRQDLGDFFPLAPIDAQRLSGCRQEPDRLYPVAELLSAVKGAVNPLAPEEVSLIFTYLNNSDDPLEGVAAAQFAALLVELNAIPNLFVYGLAIAGGSVDALPWRRFLPWRARESSSFEDAIVNLSKSAFPLRTMDFLPGETPIVLPAPPSPSSPLSLRLCELTPERFLSLRSGPGFESTDREGTFPWGTSDPELFVDIPPQDRVEDSAYYDESQVVTYEACARFCDYPFRTRSGDDYLSWLSAPVCQWSR